MLKILRFGRSIFAVYLVLLFYFFILQLRVEASFEQVVSVTWQRAPMREALMQFANANRVGLFIDRRIDPSTLINFKAENKTVKKVFQDFADSAGFYCHFLGSVVYIGNAEMREILPRVILEHRKFIEQLDSANKNKVLTTARVKLRKMVTVKLPILSEPKKVLSNLAQQHQFTWQNLDKLQHDVWDENTLPSMQLGDFLILMLIGFNLDYVCESPDKGSSDKLILRIIEIPRNTQ
ncbi:MAG: hypothetical protein LBL39_00110 [Planctomycetaceae bacterium]|jgi:hypothetical protein|nr:hypothetical protein [Planctomycetaceae bacterium]